jgi:hypothetical protein
MVDFGRYEAIRYTTLVIIGSMAAIATATAIRYTTTRRSKKNDHETVVDAASPAPYKMNLLQTLQLCVEVSNAENMTTMENRARIPVIADALTCCGKPHFITNLQEHDLAVVERTVPADFDFTLNNVHPHSKLSLPKEVETTPVVIEIVFQERNPSKIFARIKVDLVYFDGVTAVHAALASLEYMEHGQITQVTPFPFRGTNGAEPGNNIRNFLKQAGKSLVSAVRSLFCKEYWRGEWLHGPFQSTLEEKIIANLGPRKCYRYKAIPDSVNFFKFTEIMDKARVALKLDSFATTINFSPKVCLALLPSRNLIHNKNKKMEYITFPPIGAGEPIPMDSNATLMMSDCIFFNNYGPHNTRFSGKVTDALWDWQGMLTTFIPFMFIVTIDGQTFVRVCCSPKDMDVLEALGCLNDLGTPTPFDCIPFYNPSS